MFGIGIFVVGFGDSFKYSILQIVIIALISYRTFFTGWIWDMQLIFQLIVLGVAILPVWSFSLLPNIQKPLFFIYIMVLLVLVLTFIGTQFTTSDFSGIPFLRHLPGIGEAGQSYSVIDIFRNTWTRFKDGTVFVFGGFYDGIRNSISNSLDYATGGYYTSMIEQQDGEPVGLYIQRVHASAERYFEDDPVYLWAEFKGFSFKEDILVTTRCYTYNFLKGKESINGSTYPEEFKVFVQRFETVECSFPNGLPAGIHDVEIGATFDFETIGVVKYNFVHQETLRNALRGSEDLNARLNIPYSVTPVTTPGPVRMLMSSEIVQPLPVSPDTGIRAPFGAVLVSLWTTGKLNRVHEFVVLVPKVFQLERCTPVTPDYYPDIDYLYHQNNELQELKGYSSYVFDNSPDALQIFPRFNCRLQINEDILRDSEEKVDIGQIVRIGQQKAEYTFVVQARYNYELKARIPVTVSKYQWADPIRGGELDPDGENGSFLPGR